MSAPANQDADLVRASLAGESDAFARIVRRYQSLICSLAYSATGSLNRSEDLAQETFVTAWRKLPELREPAKLRAWLCGIARHLISNAQRRAGHEPAHLAEPFDAVPDAIATEPSPPEEAVTREEEAIMWRALEQIPGIYREPLVLFYREHRSVEEVARQLELSDDAVKQRLARGRALLHEQVLTLVEGTLQRSRPGKAFTGSVLAALPVMGTGVIAAVGAGYAAGQGAVSAKGASWLAPLGTILTAQVLWFASTLAFVAGFGGLAGWHLSAPAASTAERRWAAWFWRVLVGGMVVAVFPTEIFGSLAPAHPVLATALHTALVVFFLVTAVPFLRWSWANHLRLRHGVTAGEPATAATEQSPARAWVLAATLGMSGLFVTGLASSHWYERIPPGAVWATLQAHPGAEVRVNELISGARWIEIVAVSPGKSVRFHAPLDAATFARLTQARIPFKRLVQGRDYDVLGWPARWLGPLVLFSAAAGLVSLIRGRSRRSTLAGSSASVGPATD